MHTEHLQLDCQEFTTWIVSLIQCEMAYRQVRARAASLNPKSRPLVRLPAQKCHAPAAESAPIFALSAQKAPVFQ